MSVTRAELINRIAEAHPDLNRAIIQDVVLTIFDKITASLSEGHRVELRGFGSFSVRTRQSRVGRNPTTGESVFVPTKAVPHFRPSKEIHERLNPHL